ncbi:MAG: peptidylprolyl isomerase [Kofleriaceae bacterium]
MRSNPTFLVIALALAAGCEKKTKDNQPPATPTTPTAPDPSAANPSEPMPPPGTGNPTAAPTGDSAEVRPPTADDLATYTKDIPGNGKLMAKIETSMGTFNCELYADKAPMTVANFVGLATGKKPWLNPNGGKVETGKPFYDGLTFHRVIPGFMIQGGDPEGRGTGGPGYNFGDETSTGLTMKPGVLAMANAGPGTNGSQFFITESGPEWLNGKHTIFGQCAEVDLVKKITGVPRGPQDKPNTPVTINKITFSK